MEDMPVNASREQHTPPANRSMPGSVITPVLNYPDVREAVDWLCRAFGFVERLQIGTHRAQLAFGDGSVVVADQGDDSGAAPREAARSGLVPPRHSIMVRVDDVDDHFERARQFGAQIVSAPTDHPYGERQYSAKDIGGHLWTFSETIADVDPRTWGGILHE